MVYFNMSRGYFLGTLALPGYEYADNSLKISYYNLSKRKMLPVSLPRHKQDARRGIQTNAPAGRLLKRRDATH